MFKGKTCRITWPYVTYMSNVISCSCGVFSRNEWYNGSGCSCDPSSHWSLHAWTGAIATNMVFFFFCGGTMELIGKNKPRCYKHLGDIHLAVSWCSMKLCWILHRDVWFPSSFLQATVARSLNVRTSLETFSLVPNSEVRWSYPDKDSVSRVVWSFPKAQIMQELWLKLAGDEKGTWLALTLPMVMLWGRFHWMFDSMVLTAFVGTNFG